MSDEENDIHSQCYECGEMYNVSNNSNCSIHCHVCCDIKCGKFCNVDILNIYAKAKNVKIPNSGVMANHILVIIVV